VRVEGGEIPLQSESEEREGRRRERQRRERRTDSFKYFSSSFAISSLFPINLE
jgi:hypothetical protein